MPRSTTTLCLTIALCAVAVFGCATQGSGAGYNAFLQKIAADCKPLIIGSDDIGQAIVFNGLGAIPEHYSSFLAKTDALYSGGISQQIYRDSLTTFIGTGSYNQRSFDCIAAHLPGSSTTGAAPAK
jgi:hypothetical protein